MPPHTEAYEYICSQVDTYITHSVMDVTFSGEIHTLVMEIRNEYDERVIGGGAPLSIGEWEDEPDSTGAAVKNEVKHRILVFSNVVIILTDATDLYDGVPMVSVGVDYVLGGVFDISAITKRLSIDRFSNMDDDVTETIVQILTVCYEIDQSQQFVKPSWGDGCAGIQLKVSLDGLLSEDNKILMPLTLPELKTATIIFKQTIHSAVLKPRFFNPYKAVLWNNGPPFCVSHKGYVALRTVNFPSHPDQSLFKSYNGMTCRVCKNPVYNLSPIT
jgi:hypothetical protein